MRMEEKLALQESQIIMSRPRSASEAAAYSLHCASKRGVRRGGATLPPGVVRQFRVSNQKSEIFYAAVTL